MAAAGTGFAFDAGPFAVSAGFLLAIRSRPTMVRTGRSIYAEAREGLRHCRSERWLWMSITGAGLVNFAALSPWPSPSSCSSTMSGAGAVALGLVFAAAGLGGVLTWVAVGRRGRPRRRITAMWVGWGGAGLAVVGLGLAPDIWVVAVAEFFVFALVVYGNVLWHPLMQQLVPAEMIGRPRRSTISSRSV